MNLLGGYGSDDDDNQPKVLLSNSRVLANPIVSSTMLNTSILNNSKQSSLISSDMMVYSNPTMDVLCAPSEGPKHPFKQNIATTSSKRIGMGYIEDTVIDGSAFDEQYKSFLKSGYAVDSATNNIIGDYTSYLNDMQPPTKKSKGSEREERRVQQLKNIMQAVMDEEKSGSSGGVWATVPTAALDEVSLTLKLIEESNASNTDKDGAEVEPNPTESSSSSSATAAVEAVNSTYHIIEPDEVEEMWEKVNERKHTFNTLPIRPARGTTAAEATTTYHGPGNGISVSSAGTGVSRSWTSPPIGVKPEDNTLVQSHDCYIPKKCIKKYTGHTKGVQCIELYPHTGHLLLSGGLDGSCKIWSVYDDSADTGATTGAGRGLRRSYNGHSEGVRCIDFNSTGTQFLSAAFDRYVRLWDVETGSAVGTFTNRKLGYQAKFAPVDNNVFLMPASDNKIYQWDIRTGSIVLVYDNHLAPVNTVTYFDNGNKFMSTSDDKKILVWEYNTPVPLKQISEDGMQNIPTLTMHPNQSAIVGQSMDNSIVTYACGDTIKPLKKKVFRGHNNAGYGCQIGFSPNGQYMMSGDGFGMLYVWDWKSGKIYRKFQAHEGSACIGAQWHPLQPSWVVTCGWDGVIKLWD